MGILRLSNQIASNGQDSIGALKAAVIDRRYVRDGLGAGLSNYQQR
jgi:hypothetical protein